MDPAFQERPAAARALVVLARAQATRRAHAAPLRADGDAHPARRPLRRAVAPRVRCVRWRRVQRGGRPRGEPGRPLVARRVRDALSRRRHLLRLPHATASRAALAEAGQGMRHERAPSCHAPFATPPHAYARGHLATGLARGRKSRAGSRKALRAQISRRMSLLLARRRIGERCAAPPPSRGSPAYTHEDHGTPHSFDRPPRAAPRHGRAERLPASGPRSVPRLAPALLCPRCDVQVVSMLTDRDLAAARRVPELLNPADASIAAPGLR